MIKESSKGVSIMDRFVRVDIEFKFVDANGKEKSECGAGR